MADAAPGLKKITLDKKLDKIGHVEAAVTTVARGLAGPSLGLLFLILAAVFAAVYVAGEPRAFIIVPAAAGIGGDLHPGDDGRADVFRIVGQSRDMDRRSGFNDPLGGGRRHGCRQSRGPA